MVRTPNGVLAEAPTGNVPATDVAAAGEGRKLGCGMSLWPIDAIPKV